MDREPRDCASMDDLRAEIDRIDRALVALLARRAGYIDRAAELKRSAGLPARIDERVEAVVAGACAAARAQGLDAELVDGLWRRLIDWSIAREERAMERSAAD